jgi:hypothetical protein
VAFAGKRVTPAETCAAARKWTCLGISAQIFQLTDASTALEGEDKGSQRHARLSVSLSVSMHAASLVPLCHHACRSMPQLLARMHEIKRQQCTWSLRGYMALKLRAACSRVYL